MDRKHSHLKKFLNKSNDVLNEKFQDKLYAWFEDKGLLLELRAHLRQKMISALKKTSLGVEGLNKKSLKSVSPRLQAINLLIADFLLHQQYHYTLSVYVVEVPLLSNLSEFSTYVSKLADKAVDDPSIEAPPRFHKKDVEDVLQALGLPPNSHISIRTRRMYQFNREDKALLTCLLECFQAASDVSLSMNHGGQQEKICDEEENVLWTKEIRDVLSNGELSVEQLEILQEHITRYYRNAVKKLRAEEESKYRVKVLEVLQKEKETYSKLAEAERRLLEQQATIEKEIATREEQLVTLSAALQKQHDAIAGRLAQLQEKSLLIAEKEKALKKEENEEAEKLESRKSELELKEKELNEAYAKLAEEQKKISEEKKTLELAQKLLDRSSNCSSNEPHSDVKFLQTLSQQCSVLSQRLATIRSEQENTLTAVGTSSSQKDHSALNFSESMTMFEKYRELINEAKAEFEGKINELISSLELKEQHLLNEFAKNSIGDKNLSRITEETRSSEHRNQSEIFKAGHLNNVDPSRVKSPSTSENCCPSPDIDVVGQASLNAQRDENDNKIIDKNCGTVSLVHKLDVERHLTQKLQEENAELKARSLLQTQKIIDLSIQARNLKTYVDGSTNTVHLLTASSTGPLETRSTVTAVDSYPPIFVPAPSLPLSTPRRQWFNRHVGSGEESIFSLNPATSTSGRSRREMRRKPMRRIAAPQIPNHSSSAETSSGLDNLEETRRRLRLLEVESLAVNRMYLDYQARKDQNSQVTFQHIQAGQANTQPSVNCAESEKNRPATISNSFRPYTSFRPICSTLRPIITSVLPSSSYFSKNLSMTTSQKSDPSSSRNKFCKNSCAVMKKLANNNGTNSPIDDCDCFGETNSVYQRYQQYPNRKFRHYYRHWLDSHFRKPSYCTSPTDTDTSRLSPLKHPFQLKQYRFKKSQAAAVNSAPEKKSSDERDVKNKQSPKSFKVFHLSKRLSDKESPHLILLGNDVKAQNNCDQAMVVERNGSFTSSSDMDDSMKFERLLLQNQQNVTSLREKFENFHHSSSKINSLESTFYFFENKLKEASKSQKNHPVESDFRKGEDSNLGKKLVNNKLDAPDVGEVKVHEIPSSVDINFNETFAKSENQTISQVAVMNRNENLFSNIPGNPNDRSSTNEMKSEMGAENQPSNITKSRTLATQKIKENYRKLSLYNRLNDYYEEIINEMKASEDERQEFSDVEHILLDDEISTENFLGRENRVTECEAGLEDSKQVSFEDLINNPLQGVSEVELSFDSTGLHAMTPHNSSHGTSDSTPLNQ